MGDDLAGSQVEFFLGANPGEPALPLAKVASGGELARAMLALRLVLTSMPPTLVFDEVDAGIGGEAALAVGASLAELGADHQVLVVTHLAQIAACADNHLVVEKREEKSGARSPGCAPWLVTTAWSNSRGCSRDTPRASLPVNMPPNCWKRWVRAGSGEGRGRVRVASGRDL